MNLWPRSLLTSTEARKCNYLRAAAASEPGFKSAGCCPLLPSGAPLLDCQACSRFCYQLIITVEDYWFAVAPSFNQGCRP